MRAIAVVGALMAAAASVTWFGANDAAARKRPEAGIQLHARSTGGLEALEPGAAGGQWSNARRTPVSDLVVRLKPWGEGSLTAALNQLGSERPTGERGLFAAELIIAAGGRIQIEERAACGPWTGETALCRTECDGGAFALVRRQAKGAWAYAIRVGRVAAITDGGFGEMVRLGACTDEVVAGGIAAKAGSAAAEIELDHR